MLSLVLAAALATACPHDPALGIGGFVRGTTLHRLSLADCRDRAVGRAPAYRLPHFAGVTVRGSSLFLRARGRSVRLVGPLPNEYGLRQWPRPVARSPDGRWLLWIPEIASGSITSDGRPLEVTRLAPGGRTHLLAKSMLTYDDYRAWCGGALVYTAGFDRIATNHKRLLIARAPDWKARPLWKAPTRSFGSIACAPDGGSVAVLSQRSSDEGNFFATRWQLWRVRLDGTPSLLDQPSAGFADESPLWIAGGRALVFVRERNGHGTLELLRAHTPTPLASLGYSLGFYGHNEWQLSWHA